MSESPRAVTLVQSDARELERQRERLAPRFTIEDAVARDAVGVGFFDVCLDGDAVAWADSREDAEALRLRLIDRSARDWLGARQARREVAATAPPDDKPSSAFDAAAAAALVEQAEKVTVGTTPAPWGEGEWGEVSAEAGYGESICDVHNFAHGQNDRRRPGAAMNETRSNVQFIAASRTLVPALAAALAAAAAEVDFERVLRAEVWSELKAYERRAETAFARGRAAGLEEAATDCERWSRAHFEPSTEQALAAEACARGIRALAATGKENT